MSAKRIILKRSSIAGKRPTSENLSPGELGLNTNSVEPGIFFEATDGQIVKAGPPAVLPYSPTNFPEKGELWYDLEDGTLNVGDAEKHWRTVAAPFLGGGGSVVFVAPEFEYSTDSLRNDGQALPFQTLTRAILELSKIYISRVLTGFSTSDESNRYTILLSSSVITANNGPGVSLNDFTVNFPSSTETAVTIPQLQQFNPVEGGIIVPFGISIRGLDLKKCIISPSYVPTYLNPSFPPASQGVDQPLSSILKCGGNVLANDFSVIDKLRSRVVISVSDKNGLAVFDSERPHCLGFNDLVSVNFKPTVDQSTGTFTAGNYYAIPLNTYSFYLSYGSQTDSPAAEYVPFAALPILGSGKTPKLLVTNTLKSSHRLKVFENATLADIGDYFTKVQRAFPDFFGGRVTEGSSIVNSGDYVIVGPVDAYPNNEGSNTTKNSSFYANQVNLRSEYGMNWGDFDGSIVSGFKSVIANACTAISLQNDPCVYEIYTTLVNPDTGLPEQKWWNLTLAQYLSTPIEARPPSVLDVSVSSQLDLLNTTPINNIRYYYSNLVGPDGKSLGIVDIDQDFRHFGFRVRNGAYGQFQSVYTIGPAVGVWALNGGICSLTNSTSNFGSVAFKAEGFYGINTIGGANPNAKGFVFEGVQRPLALLKSQAESIENKKILSLGGRITGIQLNESDPSIQEISLNADFLPCYLLPYSLKPGSAIWVETEECTYRGFLATDGGPTVITGIDDPASFATLRLRSSDSTIPNDPALLPMLGVPYIRRFADPRQDFERSYSLYLRNTLPNAIAPQVGAVLRLNQTSQQLGSSSLRPNVQFDPGVLGGWGRIFTVDAIETGGLGSSPQFNYVIGDTNQDLTYYVALTTTDYSRPWGQGDDFKLPYGSYTTFRNRNWYTTENNLWSCVYYGNASSFTENFGPYSVAPVEPCSTFVDTSVLEKQDLVSDTYQGSYAEDSYLSKSGYLEQTYFRGATNPYPTFSTRSVYDDDDSSESLGLCLKDIADGAQTSTVTTLTTVQTEEFATLTPIPQRYRPAIVEFSVLSSTGIQNPRQTVSVIQLSSMSGTEYFRVINLNGSKVTAIRLTAENSFYPSTLPGYNWPAQTVVTVCSTNSIPEHELYDPDWGSTKRAILRFFEVMGYDPIDIQPYLTPRFWGERLLPVLSLASLPLSDGYAVTTDKWPLEFNQPSAVIANTHTWSYSGYYNYSRGLPEFQSNDFTRKLASDYQATTTWSGRLTVTGVNDKGEIIQFGPQRQALTANYFETVNPTSNPGNQQIYEEQPFVEFPSQVIVYSTDDISGDFNGTQAVFDLTRSGLPIPPDQLLQESMFVTLGAVVQKPGVDYIVVNSQIQFTTAPLQNLTCNIRVVTSADTSRTLIMLPLEFLEPFDGSRTNFTAQVSPDANLLSGLDVTANGTFVFLGGVEQLPLSDTEPYLPFSYSIERTSDTTIVFTFTEAPLEYTTVDVRTVCSGSYWSLRSIYPVKTYSLDSIAGSFNSVLTSFSLTYDGLLVNPGVVEADNLLVSLGGAIQTPGVSYTVEGSTIIFTGGGEPPQAGTTVNIRLISNSEFISCPDQGKYGSGFMEWGPGIVLTLAERGGLIS